MSAKFPPLSRAPQAAAHFSLPWDHSQCCCMQGQKCPFHFILRVFSSSLSRPQPREMGRSRLSIPLSHPECPAQAGEEKGGHRLAHSQERERRCEMSNRGSGCGRDPSTGCSRRARGRWTWKPGGQGGTQGLRRGVLGLATRHVASRAVPPSGQQVGQALPWGRQPTADPSGSRSGAAAAPSPPSGGQWWEVLTCPTLSRDLTVGVGGARWTPDVETWCFPPWPPLRGALGFVSTPPFKPYV